MRSLGVLLTVLAAHAVAGAPVSLLQLNSVWKYWDSAAAVGANWNTLSFDDSTWKSGPGRLGYGSVSPRTVINRGNGITTYFRALINLPVDPKLATVAVSGLFNNGAVGACLDALHPLFPRARWSVLRMFLAPSLGHCR
jgi:hypothetical protein